MKLEDGREYIAVCNKQNKSQVQLLRIENPSEQLTVVKSLDRKSQITDLLMSFAEMSVP